MFGLFKEKSQKNGVNQSKKYFGAYGGQFVPETLMPALEEFEATFQKYFYTKEYQAEFQHYLKNYVGRPTPMYFAKRLTEKYGKATLLVSKSIK